jgi:hypothetical protein
MSIKLTILFLKENKESPVAQVEAQKPEIDMQKHMLVTRQANTMSALSKAKQKLKVAKASTSLSQDAADNTLSALVKVQHELKVAKASASIAQDADDNSNHYLADTEAKLTEPQGDNVESTDFTNYLQCS